jgi:hypothetical protein
VVLATRGWAWLGERTDWQERLAGLVFAGYAISYSCVQAPDVARFAVPGALLGWCVAAWWHAPPVTAATPDGPSEEDATEPHDPDPQDVIDLVRDLIGDDRGILLTALRAPLHAPSTRAVRERLAAADVPVRGGVRAPGGNGPGVHRDDLPAPAPLPDPTPVDGVAAGHDANTNTNNTLRVEAREGMTIIYDPADQHRAHSLKKAP